MVLESADSEEPVWSAVPALAVLRALLDIFDLCASVGGQVKLRFSAGRQNKVEGIIIEVCDGANRDMAPARLAGPADALARSGTALFPLHFRLRE